MSGPMSKRKYLGLRKHPLGHAGLHGSSILEQLSLKWLMGTWHEDTDVICSKLRAHRTALGPRKFFPSFVSQVEIALIGAMWTVRIF